MIRNLTALALAFGLFFAPGVSPQAQTRTFTTYMGAYQSTTTYHVNDMATSGGVTYISLIASNTGNDPATHPASWLVLAGGSSGGGASNPATCTASGPSDLCVTLAPYYASGAGLTTTTTSGTFAAGTSGNVASCATFQPNQGVSIAGAGAGANYIGKVASCTGTTLTLTTATSTSVAGGAMVMHDDSAAFQAAITALASTGGTIWIPAGHYELNGPLQDTAHANAVLLLPPIPLIVTGGGTAQAAIKLEGLVPLTSGAGPAQPNAAWMDTAINTGNLINGYAGTGWAGHFIAVDLYVKNVHIHNSQSNPGAVMVNASSTATADIEGVSIESEFAGVNPSNTTGAGIIMPSGANDVRNILDGDGVSGFYTNALISEHTRVGSIYSGGGTNCFVFDGGDAVPQAISVAYAWHQTCTNMIAAGTHPTTINIQVADSEVALGDFCHDPSNLLYGDVWYYMSYNDVRSPSTVTTPSVTGCTNLRIHNLTTGACFGSTCPTSTGGGGGTGLSTAGMLEDWQSQEGSGSTLLNTGSDSSNAMAATNVTWTTPTGFTAPVATYNGTTSHSAAGSAALTNFDGTTPFSMCAWINPTTVAPTGQTIITDNSAGTPGGVFFNLASNALQMDIANTYPTNNIEVYGSTSPLAANTTAFVCATYDGSKTAAGTLLYVNGAGAGHTVNFDNLTGSIATGIPFSIGARIPSLGFVTGFSGAIGGARIWTRVLPPTEIAALFTAGSGATASASATIGSILSPAVTAPSGACATAGQWVLSQDGHTTFCNGSAWVTKI